jgi:hypothetical protein
MSTSDPAAETPHDRGEEMGLDEKRLRTAELYAKLAESARSRFDSRRNLEWRMSIGLWTLFGGAAGVVLTARTWAPGPWEVLLSLFFSAVVICVYRWIWMRWINDAHRRDGYVAYYWESGIRLCIRSLSLDHHKDLPTHLEPPNDGTDSWPAMKDTDPDKVRGNANGESRQIPQELHRAQKVQIGIAIAFALLFSGAMLSKWLRHSGAPLTGALQQAFEGGIEIDDASKIKIGDVEIDSASKMKVGRQK